MDTGTVSLLQDLNKPWPFGWTLEDSNHMIGHPHGRGPVTCMAALDQIIVTGHSKGALRVMRMDTPWGTAG